ncbi:MAG: histidinol-phosphate transaminase [Actinomycetota bacterium]|nr:histidinol-phosphate transaminase [Actinomycetota bacterium]
MTAPRNFMTAPQITLDDLPLRDELRGEQPYGAPQLDVPVCLNVNENPYPPSEAVVADIAAAVATAARTLNRYPDRDALALRADLAAYLARESEGYRAGSGAGSLGAANIWVANGSNEVMLQLLMAFGGPGRTALSFAPTYSMYPEYARDSHTNWITGNRAEDFTIDAEYAVGEIEQHLPSVVLLASPNNPTGTALTLDVIEAICSVAPGMVVVDEAYAEFRRAGTPSAVTLLAEHPRLVVTRTMSKAFALAGGRLGYLAAAPAVVDALRIVRLPYHLSATSQVVARVALAHSGELLAKVAEIRVARDETVGWLRSIGLKAADSDANFVLFGAFENRHAVWQRLLDRGVLIRETGPQGWLRVSIGTPEEMAAFRTALREAMQ